MQSSLDAKRSAKVIEFPDPKLDRFGLCPKCLRNDGFLNIERDHWYHCRTHKLKWWIGSNLFSCWQLEDELRWRANAEFLAGYTEIEEFTPRDADVNRLRGLATRPGDVPFLAEPRT